MDLTQKVKYHAESKQYVKIIREVSGSKLGNVSGYILQYSDDFILVHETSDFKISGYVILPIWQIVKLCSNKADKYYDKILGWEKVKNSVGIDFILKLENWQSIFKMLQKKCSVVIVECEDREIDTFTIGPITKLGRKYVHIQYFDAEGYFDRDSTAIDLDLITRVQFGDHYSSVISKYTRQRKS